MNFLGPLLFMVGWVFATASIYTACYSFVKGFYIFYSILAILKIGILYIFQLILVQLFKIFSCKFLYCGNVLNDLTLNISGCNYLIFFTLRICQRVYQSFIYPFKESILWIIFCTFHFKLIIYILIYIISYILQIVDYYYFSRTLRWIIRYILEIVLFF